MSRLNVDRASTSLPQVGSAPAWNFQCFTESIAGATSKGWPDINLMHITSPPVSNPTTNTTIPLTLTSFPVPGGNTGTVCRSRAFICWADRRTSRGGQHTLGPLGLGAVPAGRARTSELHSRRLRRGQFAEPHFRERRATEQARSRNHLRTRSRSPDLVTRPPRSDLDKMVTLPAIPNSNVTLRAAIGDAPLGVREVENQRVPLNCDFH